MDPHPLDIAKHEQGGLLAFRSVERDQIARIDIATAHLAAERRSDVCKFKRDIEFFQLALRHLAIGLGYLQIGFGRHLLGLGHRHFGFGRHDR